LIAVVVATGVFAGASGSAGASTPPVVGLLACQLHGTESFSPALPGARQAPDGTTDTTKVTMTLYLGACLTTGAGGKAPITTGYIQMTGKLGVGDGCELNGTGPPDVSMMKNKLTLKWQYSKANGHPATVATTNTSIVSVSEIDDDNFNLTGWELDTDTVAKGAFAGSSFVISLIFDQASIDAITGCSAPNGQHSLASVTAASTSTISNF